MTATTYANVRDNAQTTIYGILSTDATVATYTNNIVDGSLYKIIEERGFPYVIVNTPNVDEHSNRFLSNQAFKQEITLRISVASIKESVVRKLSDAVINALKTNQATTRAANLNWFKLRGASLRSYKMDNNDTVHIYDIDVGYTFVG